MKPLGTFLLAAGLLCGAAPLGAQGEVRTSEPVTGGGGFSGTSTGLVGTTSVCSVGSPGTANSVCLTADTITAEGTADGFEFNFVFDDPQNDQTIRWGATAGFVSALVVAPPAAADTTAGYDIYVQAPDATPGTTNAGAARGGTIHVTAGDADRFTSGNAQGGSIRLSPGSGIGTGVAGNVEVLQGKLVIGISEGDQNSTTLTGTTLVFEGTADDFETTLAAADATADATFNLPALAAGTYTVGLQTNVQSFTSAGSNDWTKPAGCQSVTVICYGGGGCGGGGAGGAAAGVVGQGGSGGGGGARVEKHFRCSDLADTVSVTIAAACTVGTGGALAGANGTDGTAGGSATFGTHLTAFGGGFGFKGLLVAAASSGGAGAGSGGAGSNGSASTAVGGGPGGGTASASVTSDGGGGASVSNGSGGSGLNGGGGGAGEGAAGTAGNAGCSTFGGGGGGGGGGVTVGNANQAGTAGGNSGAAWAAGVCTGGGGTAGAAGAAFNANQNGAAGDSTKGGQGGGGGGGRRDGTAAAAGGAGGAPGGGGAGGGGGQNATAGGAGGLGGLGACYVVSSR